MSHCRLLTPAHLGGANLHPIYTKLDIPAGRFRDEMKASNLSLGSVQSGGFLPILAEPSKGSRAA